MACTNEIDLLSAQVAEANFDWAELSDAEWYVARTLQTGGHVAHNGATLKVLRNLLRKVNDE